jgi:hypothetical protein
MSAFRLRVIRCPGEVVLEASSTEWKRIREFVVSQASAFSELRVPLEDRGVQHSTRFPVLKTLVVAAGSGALKQEVRNGELRVAGPHAALCSLLENVDCPNPFEGAHHHSGPALPWVDASSVEVVFMHRSGRNAL